MNVLVSMYNYNEKYTFVNYKFDFDGVNLLSVRKEYRYPLDI